MEPRQSAAVVGTFDGVHRGHRYLLDKLRERAVKCDLATSVYTFTDHPLATLRPGNAPRLLSTLEEKQAMLNICGIDRLYIEPFDNYAGMTARQYLEKLSADGVKLLLIGHDTSFGRDRLSTLSEFSKAAEGTGIIIEQADALTTAPGESINSSAIRNKLSHGDITSANDLLGYPYQITGIVVRGKQLGRTIGFPTANLQLPRDSHKLVPANGVYACTTQTGGYCHAAMVNIGRRPTVDTADAPVSIEAHLIDCNENLYGKNITLRFVSYLRDEIKFDSIDRLKNQLAVDRDATLSVLNISNNIK